MGAYMYPIIIRPARQRVRFTITVVIDKTSLTLDDLKFVKDDCFDAEDLGNAYRITVYRSRLETTGERDARVMREKSYMLEYDRRQALKTKT